MSERDCVPDGAESVLGMRLDEAGVSVCGKAPPAPTPGRVGIRMVRSISSIALVDLATTRRARRQTVPRGEAIHRRAGRYGDEYAGLRFDLGIAASVVIAVSRPQALAQSGRTAGTERGQKRCSSSGGLKLTLQVPGCDSQRDE